MADGFVSAEQADQVLIEYAQAHGLPGIGGRQLKRWRAYGVMPPRQRRGRGRGQGMLVRDHDIAKPQLMALGNQLVQSRALWKAAVYLWYGNYYVKPGLIPQLLATAAPKPPDLGSADGSAMSDAAYDAARDSVRSYTEPDQRLAKHLGTNYESRAGLDERETLVHARTIFTEVLQGADPAQVDVQLLTSLHRFDQFDDVEGNPGHSEQHVTPRVLKASSATNIAARIAQTTDDELAKVRWWLHTWWEQIYTLRTAPLATDQQREWANEIDATFDPREAGYNPQTLLVTAAVTIASLHEFQPEFMAQTQ